MDPDQRPFEILDHPADVGFLARGRTLQELFANAALAMMSLGWELDTVEERECRQIEASGEDVESLLYDWLSAVLAMADAERLAFSRFEVTELSTNTVRGLAWGEPIDRSRHRARTYVKAVTYHQFEVCEGPEGWTARIYLDV